jgi:hypothetical protein
MNIQTEETINSVVIDIPPVDKNSALSKVVKTTGNILVYTGTSYIGRKMIIMGTLYCAGGVLASTFGLVPVIATSAILWIL